MIFLNILWIILLLTALAFNLWYSYKSFKNKKGSFSDEPITWLSGFWAYRSDMFTDEGNKYRKLMIKTGLAFFLLIPLGILVRNAT